jgi:hypothetical protein
MPGLPALEQAAGFGQWWYDPLTGQSLLSATARDYLEMPGDAVDRLDACFGHVMEDDLPELIRVWTGAQAAQALDVRVVGLARGMRWLRVTPLPADPARPRWRHGLLQDITDLRHAAVRERLGYALTEFLIGTRTLGDAIINVIQLICRNLGWEWGAYWSMEGDEARGQLQCRRTATWSSSAPSARRWGWRPARAWWGGSGPAGMPNGWRTCPPILASCAAAARTGAGCGRAMCSRSSTCRTTASATGPACWSSTAAWRASPMRSCPRCRPPSAR